MNYKSFKQIVIADLTRYGRGTTFSSFLRVYLNDEGFNYTFWWRFAEYASSNKILRYSIYPILKFNHKRLSYKFGISIPIGVEIGSGFYIGHYGGIVISGDAIIGRNCNISQGVTIGQVNRGRLKGVPIIGDQVYMAAGSKIVGNISIGDNVLISANSLVVNSVDEYSVCVGVPATVSSTSGVDFYIENLS